MKRTVSRKSTYPCHTHPTNERLHMWHTALSVGWFTCIGCGASGYCPLCFAHAGVTTVPSALQALSMYCTAHATPSWEQ